MKKYFIKYALLLIISKFAGGFLSFLLSFLFQSIATLLKINSIKIILSQLTLYLGVNLITNIIIMVILTLDLRREDLKMWALLPLTFVYPEAGIVLFWLLLGYKNYVTHYEHGKVCKDIE